MAEARRSKTALIIGQGYVGLPLAQAAVEAGYKVLGFDLSPELVHSLNSGRSHVDDLSDAEVATMLEQGYKAATEPSSIASADIVVICVPTPLSEGGGPDLRAVEGATHAIASNLRPGTLIVLESTTFPGTTEDIVLPILENAGHIHGNDFLLAYSPERVDPGSSHYGIKNTPKLVGGVDPSATQAAVDFYSAFIETVIPVSGTREAETAKLLENTYRHINIALVNEMARFCHDLGIDIWEVIRAASTKPFGFQKFTPGPGVGGHCIPIDPNYLSYQVKKTLGYPFHFVELAQEINSSMPTYVATRVGDLLNKHGKPLNGANVLLLGVTYKADIADQRESPAAPVASVLREKLAKVSFHDPFVEDWQLDDATLTRVPNLDEAISQADVVVVLQPHATYDFESVVSRAKAVFDSRGALTGANVERL